MIDLIAIDIADASHLAVTRTTFQPGARTPWNTHTGPVPLYGQFSLTAAIVVVASSERSWSRIAASTATSWRFGSMPSWSARRAPGVLQRAQRARGSHPARVVKARDPAA
jgi:hypothetical protein